VQTEILPERRAHAARLVADRCAVRMVDAVPLVLRVIRAEMRRRMPALTMAQFRTMAFLERQRGTSLSGLADHLGVTRPTASALVDRLVRGGLVARATNTENRRQVRLDLTRRGATQFEVAKRAARRHLSGRLAGAPLEQLKALQEGLALLAAAFAPPRGAAPR